MPRVTRSRTRTAPYWDGSYSGFNFGVPFLATNTGEIIHTTCNDSHGRPVVPSPLLIESYDRTTLIPINWSNGASPGFERSMQNYVLTGPRALASNHVTISIESEADAMTRLLARTNPSRSSVEPWSLLQDLVELPKLLRDTGRLIRTPIKKLTGKDVANAHLGWSFGWRPTFKDATELFDLGLSIAKRNDELRRLFSSSGVKRRIPLGNWGGNFLSTGQFYESAHGDTISGNVSIDTSITRWGTVRWKPSYIPTSHPSDADTLALARLLASGMTVEGALKGAWDVIPWTWVINWFTNIANYCLQYSNTVPASPTEACVMTQYVTKSHVLVTSGPVNFPKYLGYVTRTSKHRYVSSSALTVHLPYLGWDRLSILAALFVQRFKL